MQKIKFYHPLESVVDNFPPISAKKQIPEWYKDTPKINDSFPTIKNCPPVQDLLTSGYILKSSIEYDVESQISSENYEQIIAQCPMGYQAYAHQHEQFPLVKEDKKKSFLKIDTGWTIKTPKGYSCLLIQPFYFLEDRYSLLPGIVDTDRYDGSIQFPIMLNQDNLDLMPGTPLVQVIPFLREDWDSTVQRKEQHTLFELFVKKPFANIYKTYCNSKKKYY